MLERSASDLTLSEQADLLGVSRSSLYYTPRPPSDWEVRVKHRIDAIYTAQPFYGSRRLVFGRAETDTAPSHQKRTRRNDTVTTEGKAASLVCPAGPQT